MERGAHKILPVLAELKKIARNTLNIPVDSILYANHNV